MAARRVELSQFICRRATGIGASSQTAKASADLIGWHKFPCNNNYLQMAVHSLFMTHAGLVGHFDVKRKLKKKCVRPAAFFIRAKGFESTGFC